jgi:tetratricopeptide (TPR) repeat protein
LLELSEAAHLAYDRGDVPRALVLYRQALDRARVMNGAQDIVDAACNLAICQIALKHYQPADVLLQEAQYDAARGSLAGAEIVLLRAKVAYLEGRLRDCQRLAGEVSGTGANASIRLQALILKGQALCDAGDLAAAKVQLQSLDKSAAALGSLTPSVLAEASKLRGSIARAEKRNDDAASLFDQEANLLQLSRRYAEIGNALARAAESYLAAGKPKLAADRFFLAGRCMAAQGDAETAKPLLASSISSAEQAGDQAARARSAALLKDITDGGP